MFGSDDNSFCARSYCNTAPLTTIEIGGVKHFFLLRTLSPFEVGECIRPEMGKKIKLHIMLQLPCRGNRLRKCRTGKANQDCRNKISGHYFWVHLNNKGGVKSLKNDTILQHCLFVVLLQTFVSANGTIRSENRSNVFLV